jgi:hypothetical protein
MLLVTYTNGFSETVNGIKACTLWIMTCGGTRLVNDIQSIIELD